MIDRNNCGYANDWMIGDIKTGEIALLELGTFHHQDTAKQVLMGRADSMSPIDQHLENVRSILYETNTSVSERRMLMLLPVTTRKI
jgi:hypothetical protein